MTLRGSHVSRSPPPSTTFIAIASFSFSRQRRETEILLELGRLFVADTPPIRDRNFQFEKCLLFALQIHFEKCLFVLVDIRGGSFVA